MSDDPDATDRQLMHALAHWLRKHDCMAFDQSAGIDEQGRAQALIEWFADAVDVLNVPPRAARAGGGE